MINNMDEVLCRFYENYQREMKFAKKLRLEPMEKERFCTYIMEKLAEREAIMITEQGKEAGAMFYSMWEENGEKYYDIPVYGYYATSEKIMSKLFQKLGNHMQSNGKYHVSMHVYAHDMETIRLFSMLQFGMIAEKGIRRIPDDKNLNNKTYNSKNNTKYQIKVLSKPEIEEHWDSIWKLTKSIVNHLRTSPIFYSGYEFTEEIYREFYLDESTTLYVAYSELDEMIGLIESNEEAEQLLCVERKSVNIGEAYVLPQYRGTGLAQNLLCFAEQYERNRGAEYIWVEHGTANPNARGFWNKYFETYTYEIIRDIEIR